MDDWGSDRGWTTPGVVALAAAVLLGGVTIGVMLGLQVANGEVRSLEREVTALKEEIAELGATSSTTSSVSSTTSTAVVGGDSDESAPTPDSPESGRSEVIVVEEGTTGYALDRAIAVSVIGLDFGGDPLRHRVNGNLRATDTDVVVEVENADPGQLFILGEGLFEVTIQSVTSRSAEFLVEDRPSP